MRELGRSATFRNLKLQRRDSPCQLAVVSSKKASSLFHLKSKYACLAVAEDPGKRILKHRSRSCFDPNFSDHALFREDKAA